MAHKTVTETTTIEEKETNLQYQLSPREKRKTSSQITDKGFQSISCYDQVRSKNEGEIMCAVREWEKRVGFETPIRWFDAAAIILFHFIVAIVAPIYLLFFQGIYPSWQTCIFSLVMGQLAGFGVTGGAHRYWCHRSYKAKWPLQIILLLCYSLAGQNDLYQWVRDHRVHHKFSETSADPHNANRGFFFSHVGWLMMKKHPDVLREGSKIDMSDIDNDPLVRFHI
ncbi:delta(9)-fatty-acid desaturase fat-6-like, partial [Ostrinia furnacalis]|uniref:delta(9)-fatty-acid desaturase fat-6-like n=1 Tax=Ostrinia furnacalis TaxID=93504 RepID=UPI00103AABF7